MIFDITVTLEDATVTATATNDIAVTVTLDDEVINPEETFCERVNACLDIPTADGQYVLTITGNVISWEEFSASGLVDGNGTTVNGNKVDLGGDVIQDTILAFDPTVNYIAFGDIANETTLAYGDIFNDGNVRFVSVGNYSFAIDGNSGSNRFLFGGSVDEDNGFPTADVSVYNDSCIYGFFAFDNEGKKTSNIYYALTDGSTHTDISRVEANKNEVHSRKLIDDTGVLTNYNGFHANNTYAQLEFNKVGEDGQDTGTLWTLNEDGIAHYQDGSILNQFDNSGFIYIGSESVDGSWRFATSSGNLVIQKRISGSWVTKQTLI